MLASRIYSKLYHFLPCHAIFFRIRQQTGSPMHNVSLEPIINDAPFVSRTLHSCKPTSTIAPQQCRGPTEKPPETQCFRGSGYFYDRISAWRTDGSRKNPVESSISHHCSGHMLPTRSLRKAAQGFAWQRTGSIMHLENELKRYDFLLFCHALATCKARKTKRVAGPQSSCS